MENAEKYMILKRSATLPIFSEENKLLGQSLLPKEKKRTKVMLKVHA
jgi:hypothetical protein